MMLEKGKIHATALVSPSAVLGHNVTVGPFCVINDNVIVGDDTFIGSNVTLGEPDVSFYTDSAYQNEQLVIGKRSVIRSHTVIYCGSTIGDEFQCGHRVTIREKSTIGKNVRIGTLSDVQGYCEIGDYSRLHSNVHIGQKSSIGKYVWIFPYTVLTNDPQPPSEIMIGVTVNDFAVIATMVVVLPGVTVGKDSLVGASALVTNDVPEETVVVGSPAKQIGSVRKIKVKGTDLEAYPWREHFGRGMPWESMGYAEWSANRIKNVGED
jgi:acetyltransferase-like isoleucine patch superfamily enzyme